MAKKTNMGGSSAKHVSSEEPKVPEPYKPVPVAEARRISETYGKSVVLIFAWDPAHGMLHSTTYGRNEQEKEWAAQGGEIGARALGGMPELGTDFEDYRDGERRQSV